VSNDLRHGAIVGLTCLVSVLNITVSLLRLFRPNTKKSQGQGHGGLDAAKISLPHFNLLVPPDLAAFPFVGTALSSFRF